MSLRKKIFPEDSKADLTVQVCIPVERGGEKMQRLKTGSDASGYNFQSVYFCIKT